MKNIEEVTKESITNCAELKGIVKSAISTYRSQRDVAIQVLEEVLELYKELAKYVLKEQGDDIEDVLDKNTVCVNRSLSRLRAKLEENTQTIPHQKTKGNEEYMDCYSSEEEMECLTTIHTHGTRRERQNGHRKSSHIHGHR